MPAIDDASARRERLIAGFRGRSLEEAIADPQLYQDLEEEAHSPDVENRLVPPDLLDVVHEARATRLRQPHLGLFFSTDDVILLPGFLGSELVDVTGADGLIWIDPKLVFGAAKLLDLRLRPYQEGAPDRDAAAVTIRPHGAIPLIYAGLKYDLEVRRYSVDVFGFDWRKDMDGSAADLAQVIRDRANRPFRPLHLIAHSQGTVVARRALQLLGEDVARRLVNNLVLLGPATAGTFSAAFGLAGDNSLIETVRRFGIKTPPGFETVLQSMSGLYQLLPWRTEPADPPTQDAPLDPALRWVRDNLQAFRSKAFWETGVDADRLGAFFGWGRQVDASFFNDRTTIVLGDKPTVGGVKFVGNHLVEDPAFATEGDGTVPDALARVTGVTRVYKARDAEHLMLPATRAVIAAVRDILVGRNPRVDRAPPGLAAAKPSAVPFLAEPEPVTVPAGRRVAARGAAADRPAVEVPPMTPTPGPAIIADVSPPQHRRLRVFSYDPLLATDLDTLGEEYLTLDLPWTFADGDRLRPGPVGEYLEVVDHDPASGCFYPPVDLNHPHLLAQDGIPPSEGDPRFHQQMAYAVAMNTVRHFEQALGRVALWAPNLQRNERGEVVPRSVDEEYVQRLRLYPHGLRQANAYYDPPRKAILFGYFPAQGAGVGRNLPGGTVFTCLAHDVIAHETTHALLDGLHRYFIEPSNPDVFAFHEAFADVVALFQHFSHPEVLLRQIAKTRGDLEKESTLGVLATQFGEAQGHHGALRQYLGRRTDDGAGWEPVKPDPTLIDRVTEPHARGAILVAALFRAFRNIYENRVRDLRRIATGGTGILPEGDLHPDMVARLAQEAATAAGHMLTMCIRALDYTPPVDVTFGEYLRALITADYDLVKDDDRRYRVAVVSAFRDWGIYPPGVRSLSVDSLLWAPPAAEAVQGVLAFFKGRRWDEWNLTCDRRRAYENMRDSNAAFHDWLAGHLTPPQAENLGLELSPDAKSSIRRNAKGVPVFEVHSFRPCRRIGPDGQQRTDLVVEVVQRRKALFKPEDQQALDGGKVAYDKVTPDFYFRGGCTLVVNPESGEVRYCIRKFVSSPNDERLDRERRFRQGQFGDAAGGSYLANGRPANPFAFLHGR